jgi:SAM-dependent methyltransferase
VRPGVPEHRQILEEAGAVEHFTDPARYDKAYRRRTRDVELYVELALEHGERVLEIGCGSGRILLPVSRAGVAVTGLDRSAEMLDALRAQIREEPREVQRRISLRRADMRSFRLRQHFGLVLCPFNTVLHLYDRPDAERFLARVRAHLAPGGLFVFDAYVPRPRDLGRDPNRWLKAGPDRERFAYEPLEQILYMTLEHDGQRALLAHRQWFPAELEMLLHYNGFEVREVWPDFERREPDYEPDTLTWLCKAR